MEFKEELIIRKAQEQFEHGCASFTFGKEHCALLVIDMQDEFVPPEWTSSWIPEATRQVPLIKRLIEHCRAVKVPVIYTVFSKTHNYLDRPK